MRWFGGAVWMILTIVVFTGCRGKETPQEAGEGPRLQLQKLKEGTVVNHTFEAMDTLYTLSVGVRGPWTPEMAGRACPPTAPRGTSTASTPARGSGLRYRPPPWKFSWPPSASDMPPAAPSI